MRLKKLHIFSANLKLLDKNYIPNIVTGVRIGVTPVTVLAVLYKNFWLACFCVAIACFSDWFDGFIARKINATTKVGEVLDPIADKIFVGGLTLALAYAQLIPLWLVAIVLMRDLAIIFFGLYGKLNKIPLNITPLFISKINTALQLCLVSGAVLQIGINFNNTLQLIYTMLIYITFLTTLLSGYFYAQRFIKTCRQ